MRIKPKNVEEYIAFFPIESKEKLYQMRHIIQSAAPLAKESISYQMPAYIYFGPLVYFASYSNHIGFYPTPSGVLAFKEELVMFKTSKGAIQFPLTENLPKYLIEKIIAFRIDENLEKR